MSSVHSSSVDKFINCGIVVIQSKVSLSCPEKYWELIGLQGVANMPST